MHICMRLVMERIRRESWLNTKSWGSARRTYGFGTTKWGRITPGAIWRRTIEDVCSWFRVDCHVLGYDFSLHNPGGPHADTSGGVAIQGVGLEMLLTLTHPQSGFRIMRDHLRAVHGMDMSSQVGMRLDVTNGGLMHSRRVATNGAGTPD